MSWVSVGRGWQKGLLCRKNKLKSTFSHKNILSIHCRAMHLIGHTVTHSADENIYMVWLVYSSSQLAIPIWLHSVCRMDRFFPYLALLTISISLLHLAAPTRVLTSQQRLWKQEIGAQVIVTQYCTLPSPPQLSQAPMAEPAALPAKLMTTAWWTGGGCRKQQISWTRTTGTEAATSQVHSFSPRPTHRRARLPQKLFILGSLCLQPLWGT